MNKYTELSDFEINKAVAKILLKAGRFYDVFFDGDAVMVQNNFCAVGVFNPCNNPADALPIVKDNFISITHDGIAWDVSCAKYPKLSVWNGLENYNDNFYRKAMELFLLIKDAENEG